MKPEVKAEPSFRSNPDDTVTVRPGFEPDLVAINEGSPEWLKERAKLVRSTYIYERTRHENAREGMTGLYRVPLHDDGRAAKYRGEKLIEAGTQSSWQKIADLCHDEKIDPQLYITTIFADIKPGEKFPNPNYFYGQKALDRWRSLRRGQEKTVELALRIENELAASRMGYYLAMGFNKRRAYRTTLVDDTLNLSPLFRYCVAKSLDYDDIVEHFYEAAAMQYMQFPGYYDKYWHDFLPKGFARRAEADFENLIRGRHG